MFKLHTERAKQSQDPTEDLPTSCSPVTHGYLKKYRHKDRYYYIREGERGEEIWTHGMSMRNNIEQKIETPIKV